MSTARRLALASALALACLHLLVPAVQGAAARAPAAVAMPDEIPYGATTQISGTLRAAGRPRPGAVVELQANRYPYTGFVDLAHTSSAPDGSFVFRSLRPDRNTRYRISLPGQPAQVGPPKQVYVDAPATLHSYSRGPGRAVLSMLSYHSAFFDWRNVSAYWFVAVPGARTFHLAAVTMTRTLRAGVTYATATVDPPAKRFIYRVCLNPRHQDGVGRPAARLPCSHHDFSVRGRIR